MRNLAFPVLLIALLACSGCSDGIPSDSIATAQGAFDSAKKKLAANDMQATMADIEKAIELPGLDADQYAEAVLIRAQCHTSAGDLDKAEADITEAEMGSPNPALLHLTRAFLLKKQGKDSESKKEFSKAKRIDSGVKMPS